MVAAAFFMRCAVFAKRTQSFELFRSLPSASNRKARKLPPASLSTRMTGTGGLVGWTPWQRPLYHSLSAQSVFSFNLYDNKRARKGRDLLDLEAIVWSGLGLRTAMSV